MRDLSVLRWCTRFVLAWFAAAVLAAAAAPLLKRSAFELVCGAHGAIQLVAVDNGTGSGSALRKTLDCPLCGSLLVGPVTADAARRVPEAAPHALAVAAVIAVDAATLSLPQARAPPASLLPIS